MTAQDSRGLFIGLIVGLLASAGVAAASSTPVYAFMWSAVTVVVVLFVDGYGIWAMRR